jgi:hypothetical protein
VDVVKTTKDTRSKLASERVPHPVLDLLLFSLGVGRGDSNSLLAVNGLSGGHVAGDEEMLLALGDVDAGVLVRLESDRAGTFAAQTGLAAATATGSTSSARSASAWTRVSTERVKSPNQSRWIPLRV